MSTQTVAVHAKARCQALNSKLETCRYAFFHHDAMSDGSHDFQKRPSFKHHIPWKLFGDDFAFCGRRPLHYNNPESMVFLPTGTASRIRQGARANVLCTTCFKNWMYLDQREAFIGDRSSW